MKIPYSHIIESISCRPSIEDLSKSLLHLGHEHEIENNIFDLELTPNRGDCLSLKGILRDLSAFYNIKSDLNIYDKDIDELKINFHNDIEIACPKISFLEVEIDNKILNYKEYLNRYFKDLNINKNNFFTDISNYLSYETGQPTHCYDFNKIKGDISLKNITCDTEFETLIDKTISLSEENIVFTNDNEIINLAGVIGGKNTCCSKNTQHVLIECAFFNPEFISGQSLKYDIQSEAAHKFERGVDFENHDLILRRFIKIVEDHAEIKKLKLFTKIYKKSEEKIISINEKKVNTILGTNISSSKYNEMLSRIGFKISEDKESIHVPSFRTDIFAENDIAEEIARIIGYDNIPPKEYIVSKNSYEKHNDKSTIFKNLLVDKGFFEVINFPFVQHSKKSSIQIDNPLDSNKNFLRHNLKESLIENLLYNERRQNDSIKLFEVANVYTHEDEIIQKKFFGIIASGRLAKNYRDFSKSINESFFKENFGQYLEKNDFYIEKISKKDINSKSKNEIFYCEFNIDSIIDDIFKYKPLANEPANFIKYKPISEFPLSIRDLSFSLKNIDKLADLKNIVFGYNSEILKDTFIFDFYHDAKNNLVKIGFRFTFQSIKNTITDKDVDDVMNDIIKKSLEIGDVEIPGLIL